MRFGNGPISALALLFLSVPANGDDTPPPTPKINQTLAPYADTQNLVRLPDGRQIHFVCMGEGSPTIILTAGMGDLAGSAWGALQPQLAKITRACAWDRPGFGLSDGTPHKQTVDSTTDDLEAGLAAAHIAGPYVVVGHSLGGYETLLFADRHREEVAGMVLIDPSVPDQAALVERIAPALWQDDPEQIPLVRFARQCAADVRSGAASAGGPDLHGCFAYPPDWPPELSKAFAAHADHNPLAFETVASSLTSFAEDSQLVANRSRNYGDMPLVVLTATENPLPPDASADVRAQTPIWAATWNIQHDALAALSSRGINARVPGAAHYIQDDKPQVVLDTIAAVVAEARKRAAP
jgi:pimeloyl-ACP methyl ester carboxylesterase